jgi:hypothetical protein
VYKTAVIAKLCYELYEGANDYDTVLYHNIGHNYWAGIIDS